MEICSKCKLGQYNVSSSNEIYCTRCGYIIPSVISSMQYRKLIRAEFKKEKLIIAKNNKCPFCNNKKPLTAHHLTPQRTGKKSKVVLCCRECHNIADKIADMMFA